MNGMKSSDTGTTGTVKKKTGRPKGSKNKNGYNVSEKALAQRKKYGLQKQMPASTPEEFDYNSRLIEPIMRVNEIATTADRSDLLSLRSCFITYLKLCQEDGFKVSNLSAYASMGFQSGQHFDVFSKKDDPDVRAFCAFVRSTCSMFRESMVSDNKLNPVIGIFWQRNFDGLRNDTEQVQSIQEQNDDDTDNRGYKEKYKNLIGG